MPTPFGGDGIVLPPNPFAGAPTTGTWEAGTIIVDSTGTPYICQVSGTPGTWQPIGIGTIPVPNLVEQYPEFIDTFVNGVQAGMGWTLSTSGGGSRAAQVAAPSGKGGRNGVIGVINAATGTATTGRVGAILGANLLRFQPGNTYSVWCRLCMDVLADDYSFRLGFIDSNTGTTDGVYFEYLRTSSVNWRCKTASNRSRTTVTTAEVVQVANWIDAKIVVDGTTNTATFFIDDVLVATISSNIPNSAGRETSLGFALAKTAGGTGRGVFIDRIYFKLNAA